MSFKSDINVNDETPNHSFIRGERGHLGRVLVLGLGKSGKAVARYLHARIGTRVDSMFIAAGAYNEDSASFVETLAGPNVVSVFGDDALESLVEAHDSFDLCIASPGIPFWHDLYVTGAKLSRELIGEVEFAWRESDPASTWVAITGTNGKTTTTSCCAHVLRACGFEAAAVGNIGNVCLEEVEAGGTAVYVAEVSSFQLHSTRYFSPDVAVLLNITPDHVRWHRTLEAYRDAKFNVLRGVQFDKRPGTVAADGRSALPIAVLDATNEVVRAKVREMKEAGDRYIPVGTAAGLRDDMRARCGSSNAAFLAAGDRLTVALDGREHDLVAAGDLLIKGEHNVSNALVAAAVAVALGADDEGIAQALATFPPLEHRIEPCGNVAGVECYNDSKATNVDATIKALGAFPGKHVHVLLGGDGKGTDLSELVAVAHERACCAICFGSARSRFVDAFNASPDESFSVLEANRMKDAFDLALSHAHPGDIILLSPACASFDEFSSFEQRGKVFKELVADRALKASGADGSTAGEALDVEGRR